MSDRIQGSKFRLYGKGVDEEPKGTFRINENTGEVSVTKALDREAIPSYQVGGDKLASEIFYQVSLIADIWTLPRI